MKLIIAVCLGVIVWVQSFVSLDPDFGWHIRMGQLIIDHGFPVKDPLSYTMSSFSFFDHEWLSEVMLAILWPLVGKAGLAFMVMILTIFSVFLSVGLFQKKFYYLNIPAILIIFAAILPFFYLRPQVVSFFLLSLILRLVFDDSLWIKWRWFIPLIFLLWANLHGGFIVGVVILGTRLWRKGKDKWRDLLIILASLVSTFVNPLGPELWRGILSFSVETGTKFSIQELVPTLFVFDPIFMFFISFSVLLILRYRSRLTVAEQLLLLIFFVQGILTLRYFIIWVLFSLPFLVRSLEWFSEEVLKKGDLSESRYWKSVRILTILGIVLLGLRLTVFKPMGVEMSEENFYPERAVEFLRVSPSRGQIFSEFGWGGYLVWKLPDKKVFINGSMATWRRKVSPPGESNSAFGDWIKILKGEMEVADVFSKYGVDTVLWDARGGTSEVPNGKLGKLELWFREPKRTSFLERVEKLGWKEVYRDEVAVIYKKPGTEN